MWWYVPVSYTHLEGTISNLGTAGVLNVGDSTTSQDGDAGLNTRYTQDVTIYGNSLDLAEKTMPTAACDGYAFAGWFVADNEDEAKTYAANGEFEKLYALLKTEFEQTSKVATDLNDVSLSLIHI